MRDRLAIVNGTIGDASWGRVVERLCYLYPPMIGVGLIGVLQEFNSGIQFFERGLLVIGTTGYTILTIMLAIALFFDARDVRHVGGWTPRPWLYALATLVLSVLALAPAVAVYYLVRRHRQFGTPAERGSWWLVVAISLAASLIGIPIAVVAYVLSMPALFASAIAIAGTIAVGAFPVAIHQDAAYVTHQRAAWRPNPGFYLGLAFLSLFVPFQPVLAAYYLYRRRRTIGLSLSSTRGVS